MKYIRNFNDHSIYNNVINDGYLNINKKVVSYCKNERHIHIDQYNPFHNGYEYVDLGLPSGTKWAKMNVGATSENDYGNFYQYGSGSLQYAETYNNSSMTNPYYRGTENPLISSSDTAKQVMGGQWHIPTKEQFQELIDNTTNIRIYDFENGISGRKFIANNGNYIYFPYGGRWNGKNYEFKSEIGLYWSSTPYSNNKAYYFSSDSSSISINNNYRYYGYSIRGVIGYIN